MKGQKQTLYDPFLYSYRAFRSTVQCLRTSTLALLVLALATALVSIALQQR